MGLARLVVLVPFVLALVHLLKSSIQVSIVCNGPALVNVRGSEMNTSRLVNVPASPIANDSVVENATSISRSSPPTSGNATNAHLLHNSTTSFIGNGTELLESCTNNPQMNSQCGFYKCAYRCTNNSGFLAIPQGIINEDQAYRFAEEIFQKYGVRHTLAAPPSFYRMNAADLAKMKSHRVLVRDGTLLGPRDDRSFPGRMYRTATSLVVSIQPVHYLDPDTTKILKCDTNKVYNFEQRIGELAATELQRKGHAFNRTEVALNLAQGQQHLKQMMTEMPCFWRDFQFILQSDGTVYNLDLDRCAHPGRRVKFWICFRRSTSSM